MRTSCPGIFFRSVLSRRARRVSLRPEKKHIETMVHPVLKADTISRGRRDFGSLYHGIARWSDRLPDTLRRRNGGDDAAGHTVSVGHDDHQRYGVVLDRCAHDIVRRAASASELAIGVSGGFSRRLYDILEFRMGNAGPDERRRSVAGLR